MNLMSGGLVCEHQGKMYVCDIAQYKGTFVLDAKGKREDTLDALMWFINHWKDMLYYSDQKNGCFLYEYDTKKNESRCLLKKPVAYITILDSTLYFIDENDGFLYSFPLQKQKQACLLREQIETYFIYNEQIYFVSRRGGFWKTELNGGRQKRISDDSPVSPQIIDGKIVFSDRDDSLSLYLMDDDGNNKSYLDAGAARTQSFITVERYIFASDLADNGALVRIDSANGHRVRFYGECVDKLHLVDDSLVFINKNAQNMWYKLPVSGGRAIPLIKENDA